MKGERHQLEEKGSLKSLSRLKKTNNTTQNDAIYLDIKIYITIQQYSCQMTRVVWQ